MYTSYLKQTQIYPTNEFKDGLALRYQQELNLDNQLSGTLKKQYQRLKSTAKMGKGPAIYFDCSSEKNCLLKIHEDTTFSNMQILDVESQTYFTEDSENPLDKVKPFYYTGVLPDVPPSFADRIEQEFFLLHEGSNLLLMRDNEEFEHYKSNAL